MVKNLLSVKLIEWISEEMTGNVDRGLNVMLIKDDSCTLVAVDVCDD